MRLTSQPWRRWGGAVGILAAICAPPFGFHVGHMISGTRSGQEAIFISQHRGFLGLGLLGICVLGFSLMGFAFALRCLGDGDLAAEGAGWIGFGAGLLTAGFVLVEVGLGSAIVEAAAPGHSGFNALWQASEGIRRVESLPVALLMGCTGFAILKRRRLPVWTGWVSLLAAAAMLVEGVIMVLGGASGALPATTAVWALAVSAALLVERGVRQQLQPRR
jgi:hypothetical protein